ncbi:phosphatidylglycerophosphatase A, partial [Rhodovulum sulfidophilum]|nr:phosphatidylglycerophosphatase A [Rhodovulum sulfidophilum]
MSLALNIATVFGVGRLRPAPGTWGSLAAMPAFWALDVTGGALLAALA